MHGGDIYRHDVKYDFSVNLNPLGMPENVRKKLIEAISCADRYPDILNENLTTKTAKMLSISKEQICFGNGASELIMAICHSLLPDSVMFVAPGFSGYKSAVSSAAPDCRIYCHYLKEENDFDLTKDFLDDLKICEPKLIFLTTPNNPNGRLIDEVLLKQILETCDEIGAVVVVDECFLSLTGKDEELSLIKEVDKRKKLIVLRAFTKTYAIAGVRLGYSVGSREMIKKIKAHLPEWNISVFAQMAGAECLKNSQYVASSAEYIKRERKYLSDGLKKAGFKVFSSDANYILFRCRYDLSARFLERGILIRDCADYEGLSTGFYRVAVRSHEENEYLLSVLSK